MHKPRLSLLISCIALFAGVADLASAADAQKAPRPNIVLILTDDHGYADVGFNGAKDLQTPELDRLAKNGTVFTSAYVTHPFCGPSRVGLLTGRYPHATGAPFNLPNSGLGIERYNRQGIAAGEKLLSTMLQQAGYRTGAVGKWHLGIEPEYHPNRRGFDDYYGFLGGGHMYFPEKYRPIYQRQLAAGKEHINDYVTPLEHNGKQVVETEYMTDALSREAVRFVGESAKTSDPFFLYLAYNAPHTPLEAKEEDLERFSDIKDEKRRTYAAMVYAVDRGVGRLVNALKETGELKNTLIVFLSDNGGKMGGGSDNTPLSGGKGSVTEGGFRVPMLAHWPGVIASGAKYHHPVSALDFYPTFARLAGASIPRDKKLDGKDLFDALTKNQSARPDQSLFVLRHWNGFHNVGIRQNQWKVTKRGPQSAWQLYDLTDDIGETNDLSDRHPDIVQRLVEDAKRWSETHTEPLWFDNEKAERSWKEKGMPRYESTFALTAASALTSDEKPEPKPTPVKQSPSDWTKAEYIAFEKAKWTKNGWRWNQEKVEQNFSETDTDGNGVVSRNERKAWWTKRSEEKENLDANSPTGDASSTGDAASDQKSPTSEKANRSPNILFIAVDDLRPELGCYGSEIAVTPHLDALAKRGLLFNRAYCQQAICRPSRASLMTGRRPESTGLFHNYVALRDLQPDILTLPEHLIAHGYQTAYLGKIFHNGDTDEGRSWSEKPVRFIKGIERPQGSYALPENLKLRADNFKEMYAKYGEAAKRGLASGPAYEKADVPDHAYPDGYNTRLAIETMKQMAKGDKPFFLGMGYKLPHLNWCAPAKYWDLYDPAKIPLSAQTNAPVNGAAMGLHASFELRTRSNIPKTGPIQPELARTLKHAYLASTSYVDAQIGLLLSELEKEGLKENTIVIVWGDHGWHLGDMGVWGKATNYEIATRVPLIISAPSMKQRNSRTDALVELVDIFPTLCELAGVPTPDVVEGHSFATLLNDPGQKWKDAVFSQYPNPALREWAANPLSQGMRETWFGPLIEQVEHRIIKQQGTNWDRELFEEHLMGYTMRTDRYRLVVWRDHRNPQAEPLFIELFDHKSDPHETKNIAEQNPELVKELLARFSAGWKRSL